MVVRMQISRPHPTKSGPVSPGNVFTNGPRARGALGWAGDWAAMLRGACDARILCLFSCLGP